MIYYTGLFLDDNTRQKLSEIFVPKHNNIFFSHITLEYKPENLHKIIEGKKCRVYIVGRSFDEKGDCLMVRGDFASEKKFPHITIPCIDGIESVYSNELLEIGATEIFKTPLGIEMTEGWCEAKIDENGEWRILHLGDGLENKELKKSSKFLK